jgi:hypothetical protein
MGHALVNAVVRAVLNRYLWLVFLVLGSIGFLTVYLLMPHESEIDSPLQVIYKLVVYLLISCGIASFPNRSGPLFLLLLIPLVGFLGYIIPRISYLGFVALPEGAPDASGEFYTYLYLMLYPAILLSIAFAYRLGGGAPGNCLKVVLSGIILIFSGFLDILWFLVNPTGIPETLQHAHHIEMILGHYPSYPEAIVFALAHLPLLCVVLLLPFDRWIRQLLAGLAMPARTSQPGGTQPRRGSPAAS